MKKKKQSSPTSTKKVTFSFYAENADSIHVSGDFNQWSETSHALEQEDDGIWKKTVLLPPGTYEYKFVVDGQWQNDPENDAVCLNCFGTTNNRIEVS